MKRTVASLGLVVLVMLPQLVAAREGEEVLTNEDIVTLTEAGLPTAVIVAKIAATRSDFDTTVEQLVALAGAGVDAAVIEAMTKAGSAGGQRREVPTPPVVAQPTVSGTPPGQQAPGTRAPAAGNVFRDALRSGGEGPEMVVIPAGRFRMGCLSNDDACQEDEKPVREVVIASFALSMHEVTRGEFRKFVIGTGRSKGGSCWTYEDGAWESRDGRGWLSPGYAQTDAHPVVCASWEDAQAYATWLSGETGKEYRLPSESEWEYAARAGTGTKYSWGNEIGGNRANCDGCGSRWDDEQTAPVGLFARNGFGLYDMHGNVWEWVEDCWNASYAGAPSDGGAWRRGDCAMRVLRGGSWHSNPRYLRAALRIGFFPGSSFFGFRMARTLAP